jgi:thiol:disulfide interchange protein DsbC
LSVFSADQKSEIDMVRQSLKVLLPDADVTSVAPAPLPGLYEVVVDMNVVYVTADGRYLIQGRIIDLEESADLTAPVEAKMKSTAMEAVGEENMVIYEPKETKHTVTIFTDIDCGFCRKLHAQMDEYNNRGIRIRYLFYPRAGAGSPSHRKAVAVWCADDRNQAMTLSKAGKKVEQKECENPVAEHYELGRRMGVTGTPSLVLDDGVMLPGYVPPDRLSAYLDDKKNGDVKP